MSRLRRLLRERWLQQVGALGLLVLVAAALAARTPKGEPVADVAPEPPRASPPSEPSESPPPEPSLQVVPPPASGRAAPSPAPAPPRAPRAAPQPPASATPAPSSSSSTPAKAFPRPAAAAALAMVNVGQCGHAMTPEGDTHLVVTFEGDGSVSDVAVDSGVLAGRPEAACLIQRFSVVRIPAFADGPVRVGKVVRVPAASTGPAVFPPPTFATATVDMVLRSVNLAQCFQADTSQGTATVTALVQPDGRIAHARVAFGDGSHGAEARCASGLLAVARVPSYGGPAVSVSNELVVNGKATRWSSTFTPVPPPRPPPSRERGF